jgi:hypothetical protein
VSSVPLMAATRSKNCRRLSETSRMASPPNAE